MNTPKPTPEASARAWANGEPGVLTCARCGAVFPYEVGWGHHTARNHAPACVYGDEAIRRMDQFSYNHAVVDAGAICYPTPRQGSR